MVYNENEMTATNKKFFWMLVCVFLLALAASAPAQAHEGGDLVIEWVNFNKDGIVVSVRNEGEEEKEEVKIRFEWMRCNASGSCAAFGKAGEVSVEEGLKKGEKRLITPEKFEDLKEWAASQPLGVERVRVSVNAGDSWEERPVSPKTSGKTLAERDWAAAQIRGAEPKILPGSGLYIFKDAWVRGKIFFTLNKIKKREMLLARVEERLLEVAALVRSGDYKGIDKIIRAMTSDFEKARKVSLRLGKEFGAQEVGSRVRAALLLEGVEVSAPIQYVWEISEARKAIVISAARRIFEVREDAEVWKAVRKETQRKNTGPFFALRGLKFIGDVRGYYPDKESEELKKEEQALFEIFEERVSRTPEDIRGELAEYVANITSGEDSAIRLVLRMGGLQKEYGRKEGAEVRQALTIAAEKIRGEYKEKVEEKVREETKKFEKRDDVGTGGGIVENPKVPTGGVPKVVEKQKAEEAEGPATSTGAVMCAAEYDPVCGKDDITYGNACEAQKAGIEVAKRGACKLDPPDLVVRGMRVIPESAAEGGWIRIEARVENDGGTVRGLFHSRLRIDADRNGIYDVLPNEYPLNLVRTSSSVQVAWDNVWQAAEGIHRAEICTDSGKKIAESNEMNNCAILAFPVGPAPTSTIEVSTSTTTSDVFLQ